MGGNGCRGLIFTLLLWGIQSYAELETTTTLPQGVYSPKFIFGVFSGLGEKYNSSGMIEGVADQYHMTLTGRNLARMDPQFKKLVGKLNAISPKENYGDTIAVPVTFKASPTLEYFVPTLGYGITPNLSIGIGIPIIHFQNSLQVTSQGNVAAVSKQSHGLFSEMDDAMAELNARAANIQGSLNGILQARGYKPIQDENYTAPGDLQVTAIYRYFQNDRWRLALRPYVQVPTGRPDDPDDLGDIATGGQPAVGVYSIHEYQLIHPLALTSAVGYQLNIEDSATMRVPEDSDDTFPGLDRKETVSRRTGNSIFLEGGLTWTPWRFLEVRTVYDFTDKDPDSYQGDHPDWNYSLLSTDTATQIHSFKGQVEYSSVDSYRNRTFSMPFLFGYIYGTTILAVNAPNQFSHQLYLRMFF